MEDRRTVDGGQSRSVGIKGRNFLPTLQWRSVGRGGRIGAVKFIFELFFKFFPAAILFFAVNC